MDGQKQRFSVSVNSDLYEKINTYQHERRIKSQTQAIAEILKVGIQAITEEDTESLEGFDSTSVQPKGLFPKNLARIIEIYNGMNSVGQDKLFEYAEDLCINDRYKKDDRISKKAIG